MKEYFAHELLRPDQTEMVYLKSDVDGLIKDLKTVKSCGFYPDGEKLSNPSMDFIKYLIEKTEGK